MLPLRLCHRARQPAGWYLRVFDLSYVYQAIGCRCSHLHEPAGCLQSLVAHWPFDVSTWAFIGVSRRSPPEITSLDPVGMIMSPLGITFSGPVGVFSMSPPNFDYNWSRLGYHGEAYRKLPPWARWERSEVCRKSPSWARSEYSV